MIVIVMSGAFGMIFQNDRVVVSRGIRTSISASVVRRTKTESGLNTSATRRTNDGC